MFRLDGERFRAVDDSEHRHGVESIAKELQLPKTESIVMTQSRWREIQSRRNFRAPCCSELMAKDSEPLKDQSIVMMQSQMREFHQPPKTHNRDAARSMANDSEPTK